MIIIRWFSRRRFFPILFWFGLADCLLAWDDVFSKSDWKTRSTLATIFWCSDVGRLFDDDDIVRASNIATSLDLNWFRKLALWYCWFAKRNQLPSEASMLQINCFLMRKNGDDFTLIAIHTAQVYTFDDDDDESLTTNDDVGDQFNDLHSNVDWKCVRFLWWRFIVALN